METLSYRGRTRSDFVQFGALGYNGIEMQIVRNRSTGIYQTRV